MDLTGKFRQLVEQQPFDQFQTTRDRDAAKWISQHGGAAIALVGDSIAFGISSQLNQGVVADAAKGLTSSQVLSRVNANVRLKSAGTAVISVGSNDIVGGKGNAAMLTANAQKIRNTLNAKQYIWIVPYDSVAADAIDKAKGAGDQLIALKDFSTNDGIHPSSYTAVANSIRTITKKSAPTTAPTAGTADTGKEPAAGGAQPQTATAPEDLETLQKALIAAGFDLPKYGADGKMGPETKQAILRAEQKLGRSPTGSITTQELAKLSGTATSTPAPTPAAEAKPMDPAKLAKLNQSLTALEQALSRLKKESIQRDPVSEMAQWRTMVEVGSGAIASMANQLGSNKPNTMANAPVSATNTATPAGKTRMQWDPQTKNYYSVDAKGVKTYQGVLTPKKSTLAKVADKLGGAKGIGKKLVGRAAVTASSGPLAPLVGAGLTAYGAYEAAKALYDVWQGVEEDDVDAKVYKVIEREMQVMNAIIDDETAANSTVPKELLDRIEKIKQQIENLYP